MDDNSRDTLLPSPDEKRGGAGTAPEHARPACTRRGRPALLAIGTTVLIALLLAMAESARLSLYPSTPWHRASTGNRVALDAFRGKTLAPSNYTVITGVFRQDDPDLDERDYDMLKDDFGLLDKSSDRWRNLTEWITRLNADADAHTTYKLVYLARHGEGYHNVAEAWYGTHAWDCYWSLLDGNGSIRWDDAELTPLGEAQAAAANAGWKEQMKDDVPLPQALYSSPMRRAASTLNITWHDILLDTVTPTIQEHWRETIGLHTCDRRSDKADIARAFPHFTFEPSFTEHDPYWDAVYQETHPQQVVRVRMALNALFASDARTFVSITAHSGVINAFFAAVGHRPFRVQTGGFVPVLLRAVSYPSATFSAVTRGQSATAPACTVDPHRVTAPPDTDCVGSGCVSSSEGWTAAPTPAPSG